MHRLFLDFETYFDSEYSLTKLMPAEYILDPRFEALGCAFKWEGHESFWIDGADLPAFFSRIDWSTREVISHNAAFDMLILALRYGIKPGRYGDTLSMANNWLRHETGSCSLANCAKRYGLPPKMDTVHRLKGLNFLAIQQIPGLYDELKEYAIDDVEKCAKIYELMLADGFPKSELRVVDWVIKMVAQPQFQIDPIVLAEHLAEVKAKKEQLLAEAGLDNPKNLMSDHKLAAMLILKGVECPRKLSKKGVEQWAFAKTDREFLALLEHPDPDVQALVAARIGHRSTLEETRTERFIKLANIVDGFPVPLRYSGAHTHRFSGDWNINMQNLPRGSKLRNALKAPKGCVVVAVDASQIEARINATVSGEYWLMEAFARGDDIYAGFAGTLYNTNVTKQTHKHEREVGKVAVLSLGYGSSWATFHNMCRNKGLQIPEHLAIKAVELYRTRCPDIVRHWKHADRTVIPMLSSGTPAQWGALTVGFEKLTLPNGNSLHYHGLKHEFSHEDQRWQWTYTRLNGRGTAQMKLYGAKLVENECQSLAFLHIAEVAIRVMKLTEGLLWPVHQVHDELVYVVPEYLAEQVRILVAREMAKSPVWLPSAPLAAEGHIGESYGDAK
jgi:DNA polymerase